MLQQTCLIDFLFSAKFDEIENRIPTIEQLNSFVQNSFERSEFHAMELLLLDHFSWSVDLPTAASFVDTFLVSSVLSDDIHSGQPLTNCTKAKVYVKKYVHYFLEISLQGLLSFFNSSFSVVGSLFESTCIVNKIIYLFQDHRFLLFKPSVVTAAAVAAARSCLHLTPTWKSALIELTKFEFFEICECVDLMLKLVPCDHFNGLVCI